MIELLAFGALAMASQGAAEAPQPGKEAIVCLLRKGEITAKGDFVPSQTDTRRRLFGVYFDTPKDKFVSLESIQLHDPDQLFHGQPISELMIVKEGSGTFGMFAGKKEAVMYALLSLRRNPQDGSFYTSLFRTGPDNRTYQYAGNCKQGFGDDAGKAFELLKSLTGQIK